MKRKKSLSKAYDDPFDFLSGLRGSSGGTADSFNVDSLGTSAHRLIGSAYEEVELDIAKTIREVVDSKILVPRDMKIDDSGIPVAANIYEWCTKERFSMVNGERPYIEQLVWGVITFNEYCVAKGSLVFTGNGLQRIEDLVGNPTKTGMHGLKSRVLTDSGTKNTSHGGMTSKRRKCLKITYASGHSVTVTPEHRVQVLNDTLDQTWVRAENLRIGDFGVMPYGGNLWPKKNTKLKAGFVPGSDRAKTFKPLTVVTPELARLTGYIISDGFFNKNTIGFINTDEAVVADFVTCCEAVFGHTPKVETGFKDSGKIKSKVTYTNVFLHGRSFVEWLKFIGFQGTNCYTKIIPDYILTSSKEVVTNCLRAIFDCDGFVDHHRVGITLSSRTCVEQIALLMQNLGIYGKHSQTVCKSSIIAHREEGDARSLRGTWICHGAEDIDLYAKTIGSIHVMKLINLESARNAKAFTTNQSKTASPGALPFCKELFSRASALRNDYHDKGLKHSKFGRRDFGLISSMLDDEQFVDFFERKCTTTLNRIRKLHKANYAFSQIVCVEDAGYHEVYDLTVPSVENFVCNGVVVHNCPNCSDIEYLFHDHKPSDTYAKFEKKVAFLNHGVCPHCGWGRSKLVAKKRMKFIQELAVSAGQRSGKSLSIAGYFAPYVTHRMLKLQNPNAFYGLKTGTMLHCTFVALTYAQAKDTLWQNFYATLTESQWFCIAEGTPVTMSDGTYLPIEDVSIGDSVLCLEGQSTVTKTKCTGAKECILITTEAGHALPSTMDHKVRCLSEDGLSLVWKLASEITTDDYVVVE
jgi:intein/homing endonuclease